MNNLLFVILKRYLNIIIDLIVTDNEYSDEYKKTVYNVQNTDDEIIEYKYLLKQLYDKL